ncbi:hypothetical protein D3C80_1988290 [compost metagenome]
MHLSRTIGNRQVAVQIAVDMGDGPLHEHARITGLADLHIRAALAAEVADLPAQLFKGGSSVHVGQLFLK